MTTSDLVIATGYLVQLPSVQRHMKLHSEIEPFFLTEEIEAELTSAGYELAPPGHARTANIRDLFGGHPCDTLSQAVRRHFASIWTANEREPRGKGL